MSKLKTFLFGATVGTIVALLTTKYDGKTMQCKLKKYSAEKMERLNILMEDLYVEASLQKDNLSTHYNESKENLSQVFSDTKELLSSKDEMKQAFINLKEAVTQSSVVTNDTTIDNLKEDIQSHGEILKENIDKVNSETKKLKEELKK